MTLRKALCVGAQKREPAPCSEIFPRHNQVFVPPMKAAHHFQNGLNFRQGPEWFPCAHLAPWLSVLDARLLAL